MDPDSMETVLKLFVEDLEYLIEADEGKARLGSLPETQFVHLENLNAVRCMLQIYSDRKIASNMSRACQDDADVIRDILTAEEQAASDHDVACRLAGLSMVPRPASRPYADLQDGSSIPSTASDDEDLSISDIMEIFSQVYEMSHKSEKSSNSEMECSHATSSKSKGNTQEVPVKRNTCISCRDDVLFFDTVELPCDPDPSPHHWCRDCIVELFQQATTDEQLHPPRCCRIPIELEDVKDFLSPALLDATIQASIEFSTKDRLYCWQPTCSKFIPTENRDQDSGTCPTCFEQTCVLCKQKAHHETDCPTDPSVQALMAVADELDWRQCGRCHRMIELTIGCYHMTCPCGHQFCYLCGVPWKDCDCPQFSEERLLDAAHARAARQGCADNAEAVADARIFILERHDCTHDSPAAQGRWPRVRGGMCDMCLHNLPHYLLECPDCGISICERCKRNRLG